MNMTPDEIMDRAADALDLKGWCRWSSCNRLGEMCVFGALRYGTARFDTDMDELAVVLKEVFMFIDIPGRIALVDWNDEICPDQNAATEFLRSEAKRYREETQVWAQ